MCRIEIYDYFVKKRLFIRCVELTAAVNDPCCLLIHGHKCKEMSLTILLELVVARSDPCSQRGDRTCVGVATWLRMYTILSMGCLWC